MNHGVSQQSQSQPGQPSYRSSYSSGMGLTQSMLDEQRKQEILIRLQQEREMRRKAIQEGNTQSLHIP